MLELKMENGTLIMAVRGDIDHHGAARMRAEMDMELESRRPKKLVLDFSGVDFMDSSGLGLVLGRYRAAREMGCETELVAGERTAKIFRMAGVDSFIKIMEAGK